MRYAFILLAVFALAVACSPVEQESESTLYDRVPDVSGEILYHDVFLDRTPADEIVFFGVQIGDSEEDIRSLHGEPDVESEYQFGVIRNLEYGFGAENASAVLYHTDRGVVRAVLLMTDANEFLVNETILTGGRDRMFGLLGTPDVTQDLHLERAYHFESLGYTVFIVRRQIDRVYFSTPVPADKMCPQVITPAINADGVCVEFRTPCDVPMNWEVVDSCDDFDRPTLEEEEEIIAEQENRPPVITI